ncbi:MAG TPA: malto-oligosyltrehalose trehalohydrolase [Vicinamibacterales bacterium]|nr:malto-oligosyltrehalose trehalohydrolase [Vicinamibacterales bacterium]
MDDAMQEHHTSPTLLAPGGDCYAVWAPRARTLVLTVNGEHLELQRSPPDDWWTSTRARRDGDRYGYLIDGDGPFPDPRSPSQPEGVHALSQHVDHAAFGWTDAHWQAPPLGSAVIYELHIGTFTDAGTFDAAIARLPHLVDLGITHVEVMPVNEFSGSRGWGYDGVDLFAPHHAFGGPLGFKRFVDACHAHELAVLLDVVYNHLGPSGNYLSRFAPYFTDRYKTPWGEAVNLDDARSDEVRRFFCDNALMWLRDYHVDGLRLDAVHALVDTSAVHLLEQLSAEVDELEVTLGRHFVLIAESDLNDPRIIRSREAHGYGIDAQWSDDFHHALHAVLTRERSGYYEDFGRLAHLARAVRQAFVYAGDPSEHRARRHGRPLPADVPGWRFVIAAQNHDQIGNRAAGERLSHLVSTGRLKIAGAILLTAPFVPLLFQGQEWGATTPFQYFTAHEDETLGRQVSEGRRREFAKFGWDPTSVPDPQAIETFERSRLRWDERARPPHSELLNWYRALIDLRRRTPALLDGNTARCEVSCDDEAQWMLVRRKDIATACNLSTEPRTVAVAGTPTLLLASETGVSVSGGIHLPPESVAVVAID